MKYAKSIVLILCITSMCCGCNNKDTTSENKEESTVAVQDVLNDESDETEAELSESTEQTEETEETEETTEVPEESAEQTEETTEALEESTEQNEDSLNVDIEDEKLRTAVYDNVKLDEDTQVESYQWIDEGEKCFRVGVQYVQEPTDSYRHKEDYFFFVEDDIKVVHVDYCFDNVQGERAVNSACGFEAYLEDVTFDGNDDLIISLGHAGASGTLVYCCYVYENGEYRYVPSFEGIPNYIVDQNGQCINGSYEDAQYSYQYEAGEFVEK